MDGAERAARGGLRRLWLFAAASSLVLVVLQESSSGADPAQMVRARTEVERLARELRLPFTPELVDLRGEGESSRGSTFMDLAGARHVQINPAGVDEPPALRLTVIHEWQHFEDLQILHEDGLLSPVPARDRRSYRNALRPHMEIRAFARQREAWRGLLDGDALSPAERETLRRLYEEEYAPRLEVWKMALERANTAGVHVFSAPRRFIELLPGESAAVEFRRDYVYPEDVTYDITRVQGDDIFSQLPPTGEFEGIRGRSSFQITARADAPAGAHADLQLEATLGTILTNPRSRLRDTVRVSIRAPFQLRFEPDHIRMKPSQERTVRLVREPVGQEQLPFRVEPRPREDDVIAFVVDPDKRFERGAAAHPVSVRARRSNGTARIVAAATDPSGRVATATLVVEVNEQAGDDNGGEGGELDDVRRELVERQFDEIPAEIARDTARIAPAAPAASLRGAVRRAATGYLGAYLTQAYQLGDSRPGMDALPNRPADTFALPPPSEVIETVAARRDDEFARAEARIASHLDRPLADQAPARRVFRFRTAGEASPGDGEGTDASGPASGAALTAIVDAHQVREKAFIERSFGEYLSGLPSGERRSLIEARAFHDRFGADAGKVYEALGTFQQLGALADRYYRSGLLGLMETLLMRGCEYFFGNVNALLKGAATAAGAGPLGTYLTGEAVGAFRGMICSEILPNLFKEGTGESWLTGEMVYASDPAVNEWVKILYTGEIVGGGDRPDRPPGIDFFSREHVRSHRQVLQKFQSQDRLHAALKRHLLALWDEHPALRPRLDITKRDGPAGPVWRRIYRVASDGMAMAMKEDLEREPGETPHAPDLEKYGESWLSGEQEARIRPTLILEEPPQIGEVEPGREIDVLTRFALLGFAGQTESVSVRWEIRGAGMDGSLRQETPFRFEFPAAKIDPAEDLTKTGVGTFSFKVDPNTFIPGGSYRVHVSFGDADRQLTIPFAVKAPPGATARPPAEVGAGAAAGGAGGEGSRPPYVYFVIRVEGEGYVPHWAGASFVLAGADEEIFRLNRDQDPVAELRAYHARLLGDLCRMDIPGMPGAFKRPMVWNAGPQITVLDGPIVDAKELASITLSDTWKRLRDDGPNIYELKKQAGCH